MNPEMVQDFVGWARSKGLKNPGTQAGINAMFEQYLAERATWSEIPDAAETHVVNNGVTTEFAEPRPPGIFTDDWDQLLDDKEAARVGPNGEHLDDFDQEWQHQERERAAQNAATPFSQVNPSSAIKSPLGGQAALLAGIVSPMEVEVASWVGDSDVDSRTLTATFNQIQTITSNIGTGALKNRPFGIIQFGTRGILTRAEVDINTGAQCSIAGSQVRLSLGMDPSPSGTAVQPLLMTGMLGFGETEKSKPMTRTKYIDNLAGNAGIVSIVPPPFAKAVYFVMRNALAATPINITFCDSTAVIVYEIDFTTAAAAAGTAQYPAFLLPIPLSGDICLINVQNNDVVPHALDHARLIFELAL